MSKLVNDRPFGESFSLKLNLGDLVSWSEWMIEDNNVVEMVFYGTIVKKIIKIQGNRGVCVIMIACSKTGEIISLNPFQLRLEETN